MTMPPFINTNGSWPDIISRLEAEFSLIFRCNPTRRFEGKPIVYDRSIKEGDIEEGVWHVIARGKPRLFDPDRARRLSWINCMLDGTAPGLSRWRYVEGDGAIKVYFWLEAEDYVLILVEKPRIFVLVTAFFVSNDWTFHDLEKRRRNGQVF